MVKLSNFLPFVRAIYGRPRSLIFEREDDMSVIRSERGSQQGDPLSSFLAALVYRATKDRGQISSPQRLFCQITYPHSRLVYVQIRVARSSEPLFTSVKPNIPQPPGLCSLRFMSNDKMLTC